MNPAVAGLIGAVIGGVITAGSNLLVEWRRGRNAHQERKADESRLYTQAARLLSDELVNCFAMIESAMESHEWWAAGLELPSSRWHEYAPTLALGDDTVWSWAEVAYHAVHELNDRIAHYRSHESEPPWEDDTPLRLYASAGSIAVGCNGLREAAGLDELPLALLAVDRYKHLAAGQLILRYSNNDPI